MLKSDIPSISDLTAWEDGQLSPEQEIDLFQRLIRTDLASALQGMYGRRAEQLIKQGDIERPLKD